MMQPIDLEWLGVTFVRAHQLDAAESAAAAAGENGRVRWVATRSVMVRACLSLLLTRNVLHHRGYRDRCLGQKTPDNAGVVD